MKPKRLKVSEIKETKEHYRLYLPRNCYPQATALYGHILWQADELLRLEREVRERTELDLFKKPFIASSTTSQYVKVPFKADDRATRLHAILGDPKQLEVYLKIHPGLTKEDLIKELASL